MTQEGSSQRSFDVIDQTLDGPLGRLPVARFLRARGTRMVGTALPEGYALAMPRQCFRNAYDTAIDQGLAYFEGWGWPDANDPLPYDHAWCVDLVTGEIVDQTWHAPEKAIYLGVHVPTHDLLQIVQETGCYGVLDRGRGFDRAVAAQFLGWSEEPCLSRPNTCSDPQLPRF
ncbi:hypothetical protein PVW53_18535 [Seohaeicola sp. SP36]|uniref:hypothetical protein n=1 Tax=unclassified Seohaeicola TaxID=2641111 RepID=UPI00237B1BA5|nr:MULTISPECIES: hypothetical protein [unclassified Seohaeicola]MDD9709666.1 hypothetical protein [Seohaeicola sp. 4SK31]MDD9737519.1 hypothetical protein [Seohaeicola sp. SP36]